MRSLMTDLTRRAAVILAGGAGTRLRPLSSDECPKQFLRIFRGQSLLQLTYRRLASVVEPEAIFVSTNDRYVAQVLEHLPLLPAGNVIAEPARRNNAAAIALCTFEIASRFGDEAAVAFLPSDSFILDEGEFGRVLERAFAFAEESDFLVTVGIQAIEPDSRYGYLELGDELAPGVIRLRRFTEKPSREVAEEFLRAGNYAWNGGMFIWRAGVFRRELAAAAPELAGVTLENYKTMPSISIDYALMEKAPNVATVRGDFGWSDVGTFESLRKAGADVPEGLE
jgi:mannose-1-phosphate guanylyltransferase